MAKRESGAAANGGTIEVIGSLNMDLVTVTKRVPAAGETIKASSFSTGFGGKGANQAVAAAKLLRRNKDSAIDKSINVHMAGAIGDDDFGKQFYEYLDEQGIGRRGIQFVSGETTGTASIIVEKHSGENRILFVPGANEHFDSLKDAGIELDKRRHIALFQMEIPQAALVASIKQAKSQGKIIVLNTAPASPMPEDVFQDVDYLIMNETEAELMSNVTLPTDQHQSVIAMQRLSDDFVCKGVKTVVITLGAKGQPGSGAIIPGFSVKPVDTTAAGDTWCGAFALGLVRNSDDDLTSTIRFAHQAAAVSVTKLGAQASMPYLDDLEDLEY